MNKLYFSSHRRVFKLIQLPNTNARTACRTLSPVLAEIIHRAYLFGLFQNTQDFVSAPLENVSCKVGVCTFL